MTRTKLDEGHEDARYPGFIEGFIELIEEGWQMGWHERNGGNASYRLSESDLDLIRDDFYGSEPQWVPLQVDAKKLARMYFLVTSAGSYFSRIAGDPQKYLGIAEISDDGRSYRTVWGFSGGGRPTSELSGHLLIHASRIAATDGADRVVYHAHPVPVIVLSKLLPLKAGDFSRALWKAMTECVMVFPEGIGVVGPEVPGSLELARKSAAQMLEYPAVVWASHGLLASGTDFDDVFGRMHAIVKAADIYERAYLLNGRRDLTSQVPDELLREIAISVGVTLNEKLLMGRP